MALKSLLEAPDPDAGPPKFMTGNAILVIQVITTLRLGSPLLDYV
jgi:hypothetical protein